MFIKPYCWPRSKGTFFRRHAQILNENTPSINLHIFNNSKNE